MLKENYTNPSATFIECDLSYYNFLIKYVDILITQANNILYLQHRLKYINQLIISLLLIENIHLHLMTRQFLLQKTLFHIPPDDHFYLRDKYERKVIQLKDLLNLGPESSRSHQNNPSNKTTNFPDYNFHDSIKGIFNDEIVTYNPWHINER